MGMQTVPPPEESDSNPTAADSPDHNSLVKAESTSIQGESINAGGGPIEKGSLNLCVGVVGNPGTGKSTFALALAIDLGVRLPAYVLAHDLGFKLKDRLPSGRPTGVVRHDDFDSVRAALAKDPKGVHCVATEDAGEVIEFAKTISGASLEANGGLCGTPTIILIDEAVSAGDMDTYRLGNGLRSAMALRRHHHVGIIWTCQSPALLNWKVVAIGTQLVCFRLKHDRDLEPLRQAGLSDKEIEIVKSLPDHQYIIHHFL